MGSDAHEGLWKLSYFAGSVFKFFLAAHANKSNMSSPECSCVAFARAGSHVHSADRIFFNRSGLGVHGLSPGLHFHQVQQFFIHQFRRGPAWCPGWRRKRNAASDFRQAPDPTERSASCPEEICVSISAQYRSSPTKPNTENIGLHPSIRLSRFRGR